MNTHGTHASGVIGASVRCRPGRPALRHLWPSALASSARPILERPGTSRRFASSYSSCRVFGWEPPSRLRFATAAPCFPRAVRVFLGSFAMVFCSRAALAALRTFFFAAWRCFSVAMRCSYPAENRSARPVEQITTEGRRTRPHRDGLAGLGGDEALDEIERGLCHLVPAVVNDERVAAVRHLHNLRHSWVAPLPLVGGIRDRPRHGVVLIAL